MFSWFKNNFSRKLFVGYLVSALLPMSLLAVLSIHYVTHNLQNQSEQNLQSVAKELGMHVINKLLLARQQLQLIEADILYPMPLIQKSNKFQDITLHTFNEDVIHRGQLSLSSDELKLLRLKLKNRASTLLVKLPFLYMAVPGLKYTKDGSIIVGRLDIMKVFPGTEYLPSNASLCITKKNLMLGCISSQGISQRGTLQHSDDTLDKDWIIFLEGEFGGEQDWLAHISQDRDFTLDMSRQYLQKIPLIVLLAVTLISMIATRYIKKLLEPLQRYADTAESISMSNLSTHVPVSGTDVVAKAGHAFNRMIDRIRDDTEEFERRLYKKAHFDELTMLPNRYLLEDRINQAIVKAAGENMRVAVIFVDLDDFKTINDSVGHKIGDLLLKEMAARLSSTLRDVDSIIRFGGDEFIIILPDIALKTMMGLRMSVSKIAATISNPMMINGHEIKSTASMGVSLYPTDSSSVEGLIQHADTAMYEGKQRGKGQITYFEQAFHDKLISRVVLEKNLYRALENEEFELYYQPQIDSRSNHIVGAEALIRWIHPEEGLIPPDQFLTVAEQTGLILPIGEWVIKTACEQAGKWKEEFKRPLRMAINVSAKQFSDGHLLQQISRAIHDNGLNPSLLEIEITEQIAIKDVQQTIDLLKQLQSLGVETAIDDFGTGYSSLAYLSQFPLRTLKIDRSFTQDMVKSKKGLEIVAAIIAMAHALSLDVVAEGVETVEEQAQLKKMQCEYLQGYLFSKPLPADQFIKLLNGEDQSIGTAPAALYTG